MLGNLNTSTIEQILHGPVMQEIRQSIRQGQPHKYCYNCVQAERYGRSERDWHNNVSPEFDCTQAADTEHIPTLIDVRWNTTCNLSCNYCAPACSSKWAALKQIPFKSGARPYYEQVCDYLEQHQGNIREVALVGGEPLLLPENERLLDVIPDNCIVTLITNTAVDFETNKIFRKLSTRTQVGWSLSFDNIEEQFEYVRYGASWQQLLENLKQVKRLISTKHHWAGIHAVYNIYNATRLVEFTKFARQQGFTIHWQSLYQPECLDPARLGDRAVADARKEIHTLLESDLCNDSERMFFNNVLDNLKTQDNLQSEFKQHLVDIETKYHVDERLKFFKFWPELEYLWQ